MSGSRLAGVLHVLLATWLLPGAVQGEVLLPPDEGRTLGTRVSDAVLTDASGQAFRVSALEGKPLVVSPIFTRCAHVCPRITASLRDALQAAGVAGRDFNILSVTFDARDTEEDLQRFRRDRKLPTGWVLARAPSEEMLPFLDSLDFRFISNSDGTFAHPNLVVFLTPELRVAKYLYGVDYAPAEVRGALEIARGGGSLGRRLGPYVFLIGVLGTLGTSFVILVVLRRGKSGSRDRGTRSSRTSDAG